jgi:hypothetical protein
MTESDKALIADLQALLGTVATVRKGLIHPQRPGCACDGKALCSLHAQIYNRLLTISDELARAIKDAGSE